MQTLLAILFGVVPTKAVLACIALQSDFKVIEEKKIRHGVVDYHQFNFSHCRLIL